MKGGPIGSQSSCEDFATIRMSNAKVLAGTGDETGRNGHHRVEYASAGVTGANICYPITM